MVAKISTSSESSLKKMCKFWSTPEELGSVVSRSIIMLQRRTPGVGWVRGDQVPSVESTKEILALRKKIDSLEAEIAQAKTEAPSGAEMLSQGEELIEVSCTFKSTGPEGAEYDWTWVIQATWNQLFSEMSPLMIHEANRVMPPFSTQVKSGVKRPC